MNKEELYIYESIGERIEDDSDTSLEKAADKEIMAVQDCLYNLMKRYGVVVNESVKNLYPSSMSLRVAVWKDGWRDPHLEDDIYVDVPKSMKEHKLDLEMLDLDGCLKISLKGQICYLTQILYHFGRIWFEIADIKVANNHRKKLHFRRGLAEIDFSIDEQMKVLKFCREMFGGLEESIGDRITNTENDDSLIRKADSALYIEGRPYIEDGKKVGYVVYDGTDGKHPLTICAPKVSVQLKRGKKTKDFTFKEACMTNRSIKRGMFPTAANHLKGEWYVPTAEELLHLTELVANGEFTARISNCFWSSEQDTSFSTHFARAVWVTNNDILRNDSYISREQTHKHAVLLFKQIE